jgi:glycosyltransferase involved in cell wall biosynthesis
VRPRRLCMVVHGPFPVGEPRVWQEGRAALAAGFEVDVLALGRPGEPAREQVDGMDVRRLPIRHRRGRGLARTGLEYCGFVLAAAAVLAWLGPRRRYSVIHVHNPPDFLVAATLVPRALGARLVLDVHDLLSDMFAMRFEEASGRRTFDAALSAVERISAAAADAVVTVHGPYRRELERRGVRPEKLTVVMNVVDEAVVPPPRAAGGEGFRVVYHGTITPPYGIELLVEAAAAVRDRIADLTLQILGDGDSLPAVRRLISARGLDSVATVSNGFLPRAEALARVRGASVGVIPNLPTRLNRFSLPSKLFEYVALDIPVVAADLPTMREHFSGEELTFFTAGDARDLARALIEVAGDPETARLKAAAARRRMSNYAWPASAERYVDLLNRLAA